MAAIERIQIVQPVSALAIIALVVAILGVVLALASLVWQGAVFVLSGSRVRLTLRRGAIRRDPVRGVVRISGPVQPTERDAALMREQGFTEDVLIVEVRNRGRMAVTVEEIALGTNDGWGYSRLADPENLSLPYRLEPHAGASWHLELLPIQRLTRTDSKPRKAWITVKLGTGKVLRTKASTLVTPSSGR